MLIGVVDMHGCAICYHRFVNQQSEWSTRRALQVMLPALRAHGALPHLLRAWLAHVQADDTQSDMGTVAAVGALISASSEEDWRCVVCPPLFSVPFCFSLFIP